MVKAFVKDSKKLPASLSLVKKYDYSARGVSSTRIPAYLNRETRAKIEIDSVRTTT